MPEGHTVVRRLCRILLMFPVLLVALLPRAIAGIQECNSYATLQDYIGTGNSGCQLGDKILSNFAFAFSGGTSNKDFPAALVPAAETVDVIAALSDNSPRPAWVSLTFDFNGSASVAANQLMDLQIQYLVTIAPMVGYNASITQVDTTGLGARRAQSSTSSLAQLTSSICSSGPFSVAGEAATGTCFGDETLVMYKKSYGDTATANDPNFVQNQHAISSSIAQPDQSQAGVYNYVKLMGGSTAYPGTTASQAAASTVTNTFYESYDAIITPEPVTLLLIGSALTGLGLMLRRKKNS